MNKRAIIPLFLLSIQLVAQNAKFPKLKISVPCNQQFLDNYKGKWLIPEKFNGPNNSYSQEAMERITEIHELVKQIYPQPMGSDGYWRALIRKTILRIQANTSQKMEERRRNICNGARLKVGSIT